MIKILSLSCFLILMTALPGTCGELEDLFTTVRNLNIQRNGYILCAKLTDAQKTVAENNMQTARSEKVYRFMDGSLNVVADKATDRVLVVFEQFEDIGQAQVQNVLGDLFMAYDDPTVEAHDKVVYWAWGKAGKFTRDQYDLAREKKTPLSIMATVKLHSDVKILDKAEAENKGNAYYIISSDPLLRFFQDTDTKDAAHKTD
ncbi:MAG TPA: hypothetical protein DHV36_03120 [Desulfobacteraceae bacterium]|nr:hypothetical protein [Desulfobacteraceae bacterium]|tara:strand:- start:1866 stop:2471 length:606 start_codon:yes stop_codon:yes gene_type:complete